MKKSITKQADHLIFILLIIDTMPPLEMPPEWERKPKTFTDEEVLEELTDVLYWARDKVNFRFRTGSNLVEVYIGESLNYIINKNLYFKLMWED